MKQSDDIDRDSNCRKRDRHRSPIELEHAQWWGSLALCWHIGTVGRVAERIVERVRFTTWSLLGGVALVVAASRFLSAAYDGRRALGWVVGAIILAALLLPAVTLAAKVMPRPLAIFIVFGTFLATTGFVGFVTARTVTEQSEKLQVIVPDRARELENSSRFGDIASRLELSHRAEQFVQAIPNRLRGGDANEAIRSAATRGLAFFVTAIMTLFLLASLPKLARGTLRLIHHDHHRATFERIALAAYKGGFVFVRLQIVRCLTIGCVAYFLALSSGVDGAAALAVWAALFSLIPVLGSLIGFFPIIALAAFESWPKAIMLAMCFVFVEIADTLLLERDIAKTSIQLGPLVTALAGFVGLEAYGIGGAGAALVFAAVATAGVREWGTLQNERLATQENLSSRISPAQT